MDKKQLRMFYDLGTFRNKFQDLYLSLNDKSNIDEIIIDMENLRDFFELAIDEFLTEKEK